MSNTSRSRKTSFILGLICLGWSGSPLFAQTATKADSNAEVEALYERFDTDESKKEREKKQQELRAAEIEAESASKKSRKDAVNKTGFDALKDLAPFEDIVVIQRRFLPKASRFEIDANTVLVTNNGFFNTVGLALSLGYHLTDRFAVLGNYYYLTSATRTLTDNLRENQSVDTAFVEATGYYGASVRWSPFYGKVAWLDDAIIPYDIYITPGLGLTQTRFGRSEITYSLGIGQVYGLSKSWAIQWDFGWHRFTAKTPERLTGSSSAELTKESGQNILYLGIGAAFFFPEATYR